ncbi:hypothetical protein WA026_008294 [Henosepilachna vigintioctopunctata]|uniref:FP protein C-terminal domain-containing protein n=1 Tax=Henosepilachna vigintioctopunctata TaxID=420089 RepID=A0AAW1TK35_9CUCU
MGELITKMNMLLKDIIDREPATKSLSDLIHPRINRFSCFHPVRKVHDGAEVGQRDIDPKNDDKHERKNENMIEVLKEIGHEVNFAVSESEIQTIHRVAPFSDHVKGTPRIIIVKFVNSSVRRAFLTAFRRNGGRNLTTKIINTNAEVCAIYVNEHPSPYFKILHKKSRDCCKRLNLKYFWIKNGKIFVKKSDDTRAVYVCDETLL